MSAREDIAALWSEGRYVEAFAALDDAIARGPSAQLHADAACMRAEMHDPSRALDHALRAVTLAPDDVSLALRVASALCGVEHHARAREIASEAIAAQRDPSRSLRRDAAAVLRDAGEFSAAESLFTALLADDPHDHEARSALATLALWRGELERAVALAEGLEDVDGVAHLPAMLRGASAALRGDLEQAMTQLDDAVARAPRDPTAGIWRGDALRRAGQPADALAETRRAGELADDLSDHVPAQLILHLASLQRGEFLGVPEPRLAGALERLFELGAPPPFATPTFTLPDALRPPLRRRFARLEDALGRLRGNRSSTPTLVRDDGTLERVAPPPSPRGEAKRALWRFAASADVEETLAVFDAIHARWPDVPEPYNYRGELYLYLGDPRAARAEFERAIARYRQSRWAYIGLAGAAVLEARYDDALALLDEGALRAGGPGPTTWVYRGEALRCLGRVREAREALTRSVAMNPGRVGAWVNLALVSLDAGAHAACEDAMRTLARIAPRFVRDAHEFAPGASPRALLEGMLAMLRGNRGSSCITYFTRAGVLRSVRPIASR